MNEFFAAEPRSCENSGDLRFLLSKFGPTSGRYLAEYPNSWFDEILELCASLSEIEAERAKVLVRRARENAALLRNPTLPWAPALDWLDNLHRVLHERPGQFANAIVSRDRQAEEMFTIDSLDLPPTAEESIKAEPQEYVRVSKTLMLISPELVLIDPYLNPCRNDRATVLIALLKEAARGKCQRVTCWAKAGHIVGVRQNSWEEVQGALRRLLASAGWPDERAFRYVLVDDSRGRSAMHARYMLSIKGGIRFDFGFQAIRRGRRNDVAPLGPSVHDQLLHEYHEGGHDMEIGHQFEV